MLEKLYGFKQAMKRQRILLANNFGKDPLQQDVDFRPPENYKELTFAEAFKDEDARIATFISIIIATL